MASRLFVDAAAQSTVALAITAVQTSVTVASASGFTAPTGSQQISVVILDSGNVSWNPANPFATPYEYQTVNNVTGNVLQFGVGGAGASRVVYAGTTNKAFSAGATIAAVFLAEDITASLVRLDTALSQSLTGPLVVPTTLGGTSAPTNYGSVMMKIDEQTPAGASSIRIPASGNLPTTFRHLVIKYRLRGDAAGTVGYLLLQFNGDGAAHYDSEVLTAISASATVVEQLIATAGRVGAVTLASAAANWSSRGTINIDDYNDANAKQAYWDASANYSSVTGSQQRFSGVTQNNFSVAAVQFITLLPPSGNFTGVITTYALP